MADRAIYKEAIARWGAESQLRMAQEECGELIAAINRFDRERCGPEAVAEEIADVMITCEQAALLVGEDLVAAKKAEKLERLKARLAAPAVELDPIAELDRLISEAGLRVTFDPERSIAKPCFDCGRSDVPRALVDIGWNEQRQMKITRPFCPECAGKRKEREGGR